MKILLSIIGILIIGNCLVLGYNTFYSKKLPLPIKTTGSNSPAFNNNQIILPINPRENYIAEFSIFYSYGGTVKEIRQTNKGLEIITDINDPNIPRFILDNNGIKTYILYKSEPENNNSGQNVELGNATSGDLKPGSKVILVNYFIPSRNKWALPEVYIMTEDSNLTVKQN